MIDSEFVDKGAPSAMSWAENIEIANALRKAVTDDKAFVEALRDALRAKNAVPQFPTMLRKMWSGGEVQQWLDEQFGAKR